VNALPDERFNRQATVKLKSGSEKLEYLNTMKLSTKIKALDSGMAKRLFLILFLNFGLVYGSVAQIVLLPDSLTKPHFRPRTTAAALLGINLASLENFNGSDSRLGLMLGFTGEYQFSNLLGIAAELNYSQQGTGTVEAEYKLNYLKFPILLTLHDNNFLLQAGLYGAVLLKAKAGYGQWTEDVTDSFTNTDTGMSLGLAYAFSGNTLFGVRFQRGFDNVNKSIVNRKVELLNSALQLYGGYTF